jgi:ferredoxin--NADP+ reductase
MSIGSEDRPLHVAIVGSGPTGFYAAEALFKAPVEVRVDLLDRLPTPYGLVRGGVAPDHAKIKLVTKRWAKHQKREDFRFFGNVNVGTDVSVDELKERYDAVIISTGAETDRKLGIPGEDLERSYTATEFVGWYNGHPDYRDREFDLSQEVAVVIGQGNVAMDVARILAKTVDELKHTDIAAHALEALGASKVKEIHVVGRRGPVQAKFTPPEIREMGELADCDTVVEKRDLVLNEASRDELEHIDEKTRRENFGILEELAGREGHSKSRRCRVHFYKSPVELIGDGKVEGVVLEKNRLSGEPFKQSAKGTGEKEHLACGLLFRSVGYRGVAVPGLPLTDWGTIPHEAGRVMDDDKVVERVYVAGWIKRGPSGVIGSNKPCAQETVRAVLEDAAGWPEDAKGGGDALAALLDERKVRAVSFADWAKIDAAEIEAGEAAGKPREKFTRVEEMLAVLG